jgi:hypothetical protein
MDVLSLAKYLKEQDEVRELMAVGITPEKLFFIVIFASQLSRLLHNQISEYGDTQLSGYVDLSDAFLRIWEKHVYPVLKVSVNETWAETWRGGHITNEVL